MPRVVKQKDIRQVEVLDQALALFLEYGYDNVSLNDLLAVSGTSKGAFYHYFPSKEALVTALAERSAAEAFDRLKPVFEQAGANALERLNAGLAASYEVKMAMGAPEQLAAMASLLKPHNQALFDQIITIWEDLFRPVLTEVIAQGVYEGVFDTFDPEGVGDMIQASPPACARPWSARSTHPIRHRDRKFLMSASSASSSTGSRRTGSSGCPTGRPWCWTVSRSRQ